MSKIIGLILKNCTYILYKESINHKVIEKKLIRTIKLFFKVRNLDDIIDSCREPKGSYIHTYIYNSVAEIIEPF